MDSLYNFTSNQIVIVLVLLMIGAAELGYRRGRLRALRSNAGISTSRATIKAGMLAMVGLLVAFSYSMASSRYELRYGIVLNESNAIGTCWLRTGFLPEPQRSEARSLLRQLVDARLEHARPAADRAAYERTNAEMDRIQNEAWSLVERTFNSSAEPVRLVPLIQALNEMIDISGDHKAAAWNHVPAPVIIGLIICVVMVLPDRSLLGRGREPRLADVELVPGADRDGVLHHAGPGPPGARPDPPHITPLLELKQSMQPTP